MSVLVKVCGITNVADAKAAVEAGADLLGFIFYPPSPRFVTPDDAQRIADAIRGSSGTQEPTGQRDVAGSAARHPRPSGVALVGVFVDEQMEVVRGVMAACGLHYIQLHGGEPPSMVLTLMDSGCRVIKAFRVRDGTSLDAMARYRPSAFLLDAYVAGLPGGTGQTFDWRLTVQAKEHGPLILSGGLTPENVAQAVRQVRPYAVDVASGVERAPGRKDHEKVYRFVAAAKAATRPAGQGLRR
jgi:phosphoribosylanthranilate isomerase